MKKSSALRTIVCTATLAITCLEARAGSHLWRINEVFSNADGTIQFIEMKECCGSSGETFLANKWVKSVATNNQFTFPANLQGNTANKHLLLATAGFAALPGAPTPNYIIPSNFFSLNGDTIQFWMYTNAPLQFDPGELPLNGVTSLHCTQYGGTGCATIVAGVNSPTNFAGQTGSIDASPPCPGDTNDDGVVNVGDITNLIVAWGSNGQGPGVDADVNNDGVVSVGDLTAVITAWGGCP